MTSIHLALLACLAAALSACSSPSRQPNPPMTAPPAVAPAPKPTLAPPPAPMPATPISKASVEPDIFFDAGSAALKPAEAQKLNKLAQRFNNNGIIWIIGHTDSSSNPAFSNNLSIKRADTVKNYLQSLGVEAQRMAAYGDGQKYPAADNKTAAGRAKNNRVQIAIDTAMKVLPWKPENQIPVLFATNRQRTSRDEPLDFYNNQLTDKTGFQRGMALIKVPPQHSRGKVERPGWMMVTLEKLTDTDTAKVLNIAPITAEDLNKDFSYVDKIRELGAPDFGAALDKAIKKSKSHTAILYIHGYANSFNDAAFRTAQIVHDLATPDYDLVPLMFSWPSDPGMTKMNYKKARDSHRLDVSSTDLKNFLKEIKDNTKIGTVHIIAHSMGAEVLGQAMMKLGAEMGNMETNPSASSVKPVFRQIIFAAPDVTVKTFNDVIEPAIKSHHAITTYGARTDIALWLSSIINREKRYGRVLPSQAVKDCVDTVDVTAVTQEGDDLLDHSTWAESSHVLNDIRLVLRDGLKPLSRGLTRKVNPKEPDSSSWSLLKTNSQPAIHPASLRTPENLPPPGCYRESAKQ